MRVTRCVHRGSVLASGFFLRHEQRVIEAWEPGCLVERVGGGFVLRLPVPRRVAVQHAPGTPLVASHGALIAAPVPSAPAGTVVLVTAGEASVITEWDGVDPAAWLDLGGHARPVVESLGDPPPAVPVDAPSIQPARERFKVPAPAAGVAGLVEAVMAAAAARAAQPRGPESGHPYRAPPGTPHRSVSATAGSALLVAAAAAVGLALALPILAIPILMTFVALAATTVVLQRAAGSDPERGAASPGSARPSDRTRDRFRRWLSRLAARGPLSRMLGRRHAQFLEELMELLDRGDTEEALRRAIPLGKGAGGGLPAWAMPGRREAIRINPLPSGGTGSSIFAADPVLDGLRQRYEALFTRLDGQGRVDEAAFVLGELCGDWPRAVTYLERHGRARLAAEAAEGHDLDVGLVIHLWLKAGDPGRAISIARKRQGFAAAVQRLQGRPRTPAEDGQLVELRLLWADAFAAEGDFLGAVQATEPVITQLEAGARARCLEWMRRGAEGDGAPAAWLLVAALVHDVELRATWQARVLTAIGDLSEAGREARFALLRALIERPDDVTRVVARPAARLLLAESEALPAAARLALDVARHASDPVLLADLPTLRPPAEPAVTPPVCHVVEARDRGQLPVFDVAYLADGRVVVALGEVGVRVHDRRRTWLVPEPAHRLVVTARGTQALALAPRDETTRVARLDLRARTGVPWGELHLLAHTPVLRQGLWAVALRDRGEPVVALLDTERDRPTAVFQVDRIGSSVEAIAYDEGGLTFVTGSPLTTWRYDPSLVLRERAAWTSSPDQRHWLQIAVHGSGARVGLHDAPRQTSPLRLAGSPSATTPMSVAHLEDLADPLALEHGGEHVALARTNGTEVLIEAWSAQPLRQELAVRLGGASRATMRLQGGALVVGDDRGRILRLGLKPLAAEPIGSRRT